MNLVLKTLQHSDWNSVSKIYAQGIETGIATFETEIPNWQTWNSKYIDVCRIIAKLNDAIVGFAVLSKVSDRNVYSGVAEVSVYVDQEYRHNGIGEVLLRELIDQSEQNGYWTLQAGIFSENVASIELHKKCGFRVLGIKEKIGKLNEKWYDNHFLERRSKKVG